MPFQPVQNTVEVKMFAQCNGNMRLNQIHYRYSGARPTAQNLRDLCEDVVNGIGLVQNATMHTSSKIIQTSARDIHDEAGLEVFSSTQHTGLVGGDKLPGNCAFVLTKRTEFVGRSFRGRYYLYDLGESFFDADQVSTSMLPTLALLSGALTATRVGGMFKPAVASKVLGISTLFSVVTFDGTADSQRRRLTGRGY